MRLRKHSGWWRVLVAARVLAEVGGKALLLFLCPPGPRGRRTLSVTEAEAKGEIGANGE